MILSQVRVRVRAIMLKVLQLVLRLVLEEKLQTFCYISFFYVMCTDKKFIADQNFYSTPTSQPHHYYYILLNIVKIFLNKYAVSV